MICSPAQRGLAKCNFDWTVALMAVQCLLLSVATSRPLLASWFESLMRPAMCSPCQGFYLLSLEARREPVRSLDYCVEGGDAQFQGSQQAGSKRCC
jgi:hypothetical protein